MHEEVVKHNSSSIHPQLSFLVEVPLGLLLASIVISVSAISFSIGLFYLGTLIFLVRNRSLIEWKKKLRDPLFMLFLFFVSWLWVSEFITSISNQKALILFRMTLMLFMFPALYLLADKIRWRIPVIFFSAAITVAVFFALYQFLFGFNAIPALDLEWHHRHKRTGGFHDNPAHFAGILLAAAMLALIMVAFPDKQRKFTHPQALFIVSICFLLFTLLGLVLTQTRAAVIALLVTSVIFVIFNRQQIKFPWLYPILGLGLIIVLFFLTLAFTPYWWYQERFLSFLSPGENIKNFRLDHLQLGFQLGLNHPIWGAGAEGYIEAFKAWKGGGAKKLHWHPHNDLLNLFILGGVPLLVSILGMHILLVYRFFSNYRKNPLPNSYIQTGLIFLLLSLLLYGLTDVILFCVTAGYIYWLILGVCACYSIPTSNRGFVSFKTDNQNLKF